VPELQELQPDERLKVFRLLIRANVHCFSKGKYQEVTGQEILENLFVLAKTDSFFLAHLVSRRENTKDLQVLSTIAQFHTDADGKPFSQGSEFNKPDLIPVAQASILQIDPKLAHRALWLMSQKFSNFRLSKDGDRFLSRPARRAFGKYLKYREINISVMKKAVETGLSRYFKDMYRLLHLVPSNEAAQILRWKQKDGSLVIEKTVNLFDGLTPQQIAKKIIDDQIPFQKAISQIGNMTPAIGQALVSVASVRQLVIYTSTWEELGLFNNPDFVSLYQEKTSQVGDQTDRIDASRLKSTKAKEIVAEAKSEQRKTTLSYALEELGIRKIRIHIDLSGSMYESKQIACKAAAKFAEMIPKPQENLEWGYFNDKGYKLNLPTKLTEDAFMASIYAINCGGSTDTIALYDGNKDLEVWITDGDHNIGSLSRLNKVTNHSYKAVVIKAGSYNYTFNRQLSEYIPQVIVIEPKVLDESNKVVEAIAVAIKGETVIIDEIMNNKLLELPRWFNEI